MIERFQLHLSRHKTLLEKWLAAHCIALPPDEMISDHGYISDNCAVAFLFKTPHKTCYIDNVAADPEATTDSRDLALERVFAKLELDAFYEGFKLITVLAKLPRMKARLERLGYRRHGDYSLYFRVPGG